MDVDLLRTDAFNTVMGGIIKKFILLFVLPYIKKAMTQHFSNFECQKLTLHPKNDFQGTISFSDVPSHQPIRFSNFLRRVLISETPHLSLRVGFCGTWTTDFLRQTTSIDFVYSNFFFKKRNGFRQKSLGELGYISGIDLQDLTTQINQLPLVFTEQQEKLNKSLIRLCVQGPGQIRAAHLHFPKGVYCLTPNVVLAEISDTSILEIYYFLQITSTSLSSWNAYHIGYKSLPTGQNRSIGTGQLQLWGDSFAESTVFPTDTRKAFYRGINLSLQPSNEFQLKFFGSLNNDLNTRLPQAIKRFHTTLQRLQQQNPAQPLLMVREPEPLGYVTTIKRAPYSDLISRFSLKEISRKEEGFE